VAVTAALLIASTAVTVAIAGPVLAVEAGGDVKAIGVVVDVALVAGLPMLVGLAGRSLVRRSRRLTAVLEPVPIVAVVALVALVASQVHLARAYVGVTVALIGFIAASTAAGAVVARLAPPPEATAIVLSTSIRDFAIASGIAASAFGAEAAAPLGLYGVLVIGWSAVLAGWSGPARSRGLVDGGAREVLEERLLVTERWDRPVGDPLPGRLDHADDVVLAHLGDP